MRTVIHANVAGLNMAFVGFPQDRSMWFGWDEFFIDGDIPAPDLCFYFKQETTLRTEIIFSYSIGALGFKVKSDQTIFGYFDDRNTNKVQAIAGKGWRETILQSHEPILHAMHFSFFTDIVYRTRLSDFSGFTAHASVIEYNGCAVMFPATSGVGKSTHAELWQAHFSASIINGDHAVIRMVDGSPIIFGAPWSGTSPYKKKVSAPLKAIVLLEQGDRNDISKLDAQQALTRCFPHCYLPYWDKASMAKTLCTFDAVLGLLPVYLLKCLPNKDAAELVRATVFTDYREGI